MPPELDIRSAQQQTTGQDGGSSSSDRLPHRTRIQIVAVIQRHSTTICCLHQPHDACQSVSSTMQTGSAYTGLILCSTSSSKQPTSSLKIFLLVNAVFDVQFWPRQITQLSKGRQQTRRFVLVLQQSKNVQHIRCVQVVLTVLIDVWCDVACDGA